MATTTRLKNLGVKGSTLAIVGGVDSDGTNASKQHINIPILQLQIDETSGAINDVKIHVTTDLSGSFVTASKTL